MVDEEHLPVREITDPRTLRAVAHPVRVRILEELLIDGPLTATDLAGRLDETPANCSWHLRQLARHHFVAEAGGGTGRRRPWQIVPQGHRWGADKASDPDSGPDQELSFADAAAMSVLLNREVAVLQEWLRQGGRAPARWRAAAYVNQSVCWLTAEELAELGRAYADLLRPYLSRLNRPARRPAGAQPVRFVAWAVPARTPEAAGDGPVEPPVGSAGV